MKKSVITEDQFDELPPQSQMYYLYCPKCGFFFLATKTRTHICGNPNDISVEEMLKREG